MRRNIYHSREIAVRRKIARRLRELRMLRSIERALAKFRQESQRIKDRAKDGNGGAA